MPKIIPFYPISYGGEDQVWDITMDKSGMLYLANADGVLRFDGANWSELRLPGGPTVRTLAVTEDRLYAGGYGQFGYFPLGEGEPAGWVSLSDQLSSPDREEEIWNIEILEGELVVFQSFGRLFVYDGQHTSTVVPPGVMMFAAAEGPTLLVPVTGQGVFSWRSGQGFSLLPGTRELGQRQVVSVVPSADGLILSTADSVFMLKDERLASWDERLNARLEGKKINRLSLLADGSLAIGTIGSGLVLFDPERGKLLPLAEASGLSNNTVLALYESPAGNLWLGLDRGLDLIVRSPTISFVTGESRPPGTVYTAAFYAGRAYFGTNQGLYVQRETAEGFAYSLVPGTSGQVWELRETPNGLLCGHNDGTFLVVGASARKVSDRSGGWMTISNGEPDQLIQATYTGLQFLEDEDGTFVGRDLPGLSAPIRQLMWADDDKLLAIHGSRGAFLLTLSDHPRRILQVDTLNDPVLAKASAVRSPEGILLQSPDGHRLLRKDSLVPYGLISNTPLPAGEYFLSGNDAGLWFISGPDRLKAYQGEDIIAELPLRLRFPYPKIIPWPEGGWLCLLDEGYALINPRPEASPARTMALRAGHRVGDKWERLPGGEELAEVAYRDNDLRFSAALPVFDRQVNYRSRLAGYADEWTGWTKSGERVFTNLPEGDYLFEVEANWFGSRATLRFTVLPPWYRSRIAYILYALLLAATLWILYRLHLQRLRNQARRLEVVRQREVQRERIVARNRELKADVQRKSKELANTTLTLAKKNEMLLALREEIAKARRRPGSPLDHRRMQHLIDQNLNNDEDWAIFESHFNEVHEAFLKRLRKSHQELTTGDLKLAAYLRMDLSSKEIAPLLHISLRGVENKRYRLRKKLGLEGGDDLNRYLLEF